MSEQSISFECADCDMTVTAPKDSVDENDDGYLVCEDCAGPPSWEDQDFPIWVEMEHYEDNWEMLRYVMEQTGVPEDDIPAGQMKYTVFQVWFKVDEAGNVEGPYDAKRGGKL